MAGAASALDYDERPVLSGDCVVRDAPAGGGSRGTLFLTTAKRLVFVAAEGIVMRRYEKAHEVPLSSVTSARVESGLLGFVESLVVEARASDGRTFTYRYEGVPRPEVWRARLLEWKEEQTAVEAARSGLVALLRSQERTSFDQIRAHWVRMRNSTVSDEWIAETLRTLIRQGEVDGFLDENRHEFVHMSAYKQKTETVQYTIATSFEFGKDGTLAVRCPSCNAPSPRRDRASQVTCGHCGTTYILPKKILDMI